MFCVFAGLGNHIFCLNLICAAVGEDFSVLLFAQSFAE